MKLLRRANLKAMMAVMTAAVIVLGFLVLDVKADSGIDPVLELTSNAPSAVRKGDYFTVDAALEEMAPSNTAQLDLKYDTDKFSFANFTPAQGVTLLTHAAANGGHTLIVMQKDYELTDIGSIMFLVKEDAVLTNEENDITVTLQVVVQDPSGAKEILTASDTVFVRDSSNTVPGDVNGDGVLDLIDLSDLIDAFGMTSGDDLWWKYAAFDYNNNGQIDVYDISYLAYMINA